MSTHSPGFPDLLFLAYVLAFGVAAVACFWSLRYVDRVDESETRRGLAGLVATSGAWAATHVAFLVAPGVGAKTAFYTVGLVLGLSTIGFWLYFCSAYTGRTLHREATYQRVAVVVFLLIVGVKLTNPLHGLYFSATPDPTPFPHLAIRHHLAHWLVMALSYGLAMVGYFMLFERFTAVSYDTRPLLGLLGLTALPVVFDVAGFGSPYLIDMTYEPLGVAAFAVGILVVYVDRFRAVRVAGGREEPAIVLDEDDHIRECNDSARALFPEQLSGEVVGKPLWEAVPDVAAVLGRGSSVIEVERGGETRYYQVSESPFAAGQRQLGRIVVLADVTHRERYRRELERQNERLDEFASMVSHDLRNPLNVAQGRVAIAREAEDGDSEHLEAAANALDRMEALIEDVLALARQGRPIDETEAVRLDDAVEECWEMVASADATMQIDSDRAVVADASRLHQLLENLFRNAVEHGGEGVTVTVGDLAEGFYVADDGPGVPEEERDDVFESGYSTETDGTGFGLSIVGEICAAHGWEVTLSESESGGARFEFTGVEFAPESEA